MAKKKKQEMTLEEKLEQALVPEDVQPYEVPSNWVWIRLLISFDNLTNSRKKIQKKDYLIEGNYAVIDQGKELIGGFTNNKELLFDGKLPIVLFGDHTRIIKYIDFLFVQGADGVKILKPKCFYNPKFYYYLMQNIEIPDLGYRRHFSLFPTFSCVLPPLAEQQRIVDRIERLFEKLDQAKALAQNALDTFETRKAAILHKAFTGELTVKWRNINGIEFNSWKNKKFEQFCYLNRGFDLPASQRKSGPYPLVSSSGIIDVHTEAKAKSPGVVTGRSGSIGKVFYIEKDYWPLNTTLYSKNMYDNNAKYIYYYLTNFDFKQYSSSTAVPTLNRNNFSDVEVAIPTIDEQQEIVRILENLFVKEQKTKELCEEIIDKIDLMKKSILARAFRGELGTNDPREESAIELLKKCL